MGLPPVSVSWPEHIIYLFFSDCAKKNVPSIRHPAVSTAMAAKFRAGLNITTLSYSGVPAYITARARQ